MLNIHFFSSRSQEGEGGILLVLLMLLLTLKQDLITYEHARHLCFLHINIGIFVRQALAFTIKQFNYEKPITVKGPLRTFRDLLLQQALVASTGGAG